MIKDVTKHNLSGIEVDSKLFAIATINMLIRNGVSDNIFHDNIFTCTIEWGGEGGRKQPNRLLMNPPYSQAKKSETSNESEMQFILRALSFLPKDGSVTMNVYTHIGFDDAEEELKRMEEFRKAQAEVEQKKEKPMSQKMFKVV